MSAYGTENIRNIALVGHAGSGKTSLVESLLHQGGAINQPGAIDKGTTVCDYDPEEKQHQHSIGSALAALDVGQTHINLIDTPGYPEFIGQALGVLPAADSIAVVINAQHGIEFMTRRYMAWAEKYHYCRAIIINKIDAVSAKQLHAQYENIRDVFGNHCLAANLPGKDGQSIVDCFFHDSGQTAFLSVPQVHTQIVDQVVEVDEKLMARYLEQGHIAVEQLHEPFEKALRDNHIIPVCFVSSVDGRGIKELLDVFVRMMPNPFEGTRHPFMDEGGRQVRTITPSLQADQHVIAHVFKLIHDPYVGKIGVMRVHQGTIHHNTQLYVGEQRKAIKVNHLVRIHGNDYKEMVRAIPGDLCGIPKVDEFCFNAIVHNSHDEDHVHALDYQLPVPMIGLAIDAKKHGDEQKLFEAMEKLAAEDVCLEIDRNADSNETILRGMGELQLRIAIEKLTGRFQLAIETHSPSIAYRETITASADGIYRHKKQSGGAGQFGEVSLRVEPLDRGEGFVFENKVVGGAIPGQFIPAVEKGVRQAIHDGAVAGYPIADVRVQVLDGKHHSVDSNEIAFVTAGRKAFLSAVAEANPIVLEPIMHVEIIAAQDKTGDLSGDLVARRGQIHGTQSNVDGNMIISAKVPLSELESYHSHIKSMTGGEGIYTMEFDRYQPAPAGLQKKLMAKHRAKK